MAEFRVVYKSMCTGGEHVTLTVLRDSVPVRDFTVTRTQMLTNDLSWEEVLPFFLRETIKRAGASNLAQARTAIEAARWVF